MSRFRACRGPLVGACRALGRGIVLSSALLAGTLSNAHGQTGTRFADRTAVLLGAGAGVASIDLPDANQPSQRFGAHGRIVFDLGGEVRPWLELGGSVGFTALGESDSLNAILAANGSTPVSSITHLQSAVVARVRWLHGSTRWAPYARVGAGLDGLWTSAAGGLGGHVLDPGWDAGAGLEVYAHRLLVVRAEGLYAGQATEDGARHHFAATASLLLALPRSMFD
jgi:hypothetical protein